VERLADHLGRRPGATISGAWASGCASGAEVLDPLGVSWRIEIPQGAAEVPLHPERRRHVYLLLKEALTNAARHSAARHLVLGVSVVEGDLSFTLHDDGRGFDTGLTSGERRLVGGNGLANMKTRAEALGGKLLVTSAPGKGTRITLKIPLTGA
jgi:signal transduction histidine kinase